MTSALAAILLAPMVLLAPAAEVSGPESDPARAFVVTLVEAINSKSLERRRALLHPKLLPCAGQPDSFYPEMVTRQSRDAIPANYTWKLTPVPADAPLMFADKLDYPVRPTHTLQLDFQMAPSRGKTLLLLLVHEADHWYEMIACPKPGTVTAARRARQAAAIGAQRVQALAAAVPPELKDRLLELVKRGRRLDAITHYQRASGEDLTTAVSVVDVLAPRDR